MILVSSEFKQASGTSMVATLTANQNVYKNQKRYAFIIHTKSTTIHCYYFVSKLLKKSAEQCVYKVTAVHK